MKNKLNVLSVRVFGIIAFMTVFTFSAATCSGQSGGGGKSINSPEELKKYLDSQPANSPNNPIKVSMGANAPMLPKIKDVLNSAGKYVILNITGNALTTIPENAFRGCETLVSITIPDSVTSIDDFAFFQCKSLTSVTIPNSVTFIGESAFAICTSLTSLTIGNGITRIPTKAFWGCTSLTSITIPNSVTDIWDKAFLECTNLTSITIPNSVTSIGWETFNFCTSLTSVTFQGTIAPNNLYSKWDYYIQTSFTGDLREKYLAGGIGTYTTTAPVNADSKWTKK
jgi:hypothetical protein